jgi:hypothetical protein
MTEDYNVLEAVAGEMFDLKNELGNTMKNLAETKSSLAESNRNSTVSAFLCDTVQTFSLPFVSHC